MREPAPGYSELLEKLAALIPRPRINLVVSHGVLAPHARWRDRAVSSEGPRLLQEHPAAHPAAPPPSEPRDGVPGKPRYWAWADLMRRAFELDVLACPRCGGRMRLIATLEDPRGIRQILAHLGLPPEGPAAGPARPPPGRTGDLFADTPA